MPGEEHAPTDRTRLQDHGWRKWRDVAQAVTVIGALASMAFWTHFQTKANAGEITVIKQAQAAAATEAQTRQEKINDELVRQSGVNATIEERTKRMNLDIQEILRIMRSTSR